MLSITKIGSAGRVQRGYLAYLAPQRIGAHGDFDEYARGGSVEGPAPFWAGRGVASLQLHSFPTREAVERLAAGVDPRSGAAMVHGAGADHVMGLDLTFSAPKDVSALFAAADEGTQAAIVQALQASVRVALSHSESLAVARRGHAGRIKEAVKAVVAAVYTHFASRALDPQLHAHAFVFNLGLRADGAWAALDGKPHFEAKLATGALFRVELASRMKALGFGIEPDGPYFKIAGVEDQQRRALSTRSREIQGHLAHGESGSASQAERDAAALATRSAKAEPPLPQLLELFKQKAADLGLTPALVASWRGGAKPDPLDELVIDHADLLAELTQSSSVATPHEALALICEKAMGRWSAAQCLRELDLFLESPLVARLGHTEHLTPVFTSRAMLGLEADIDRAVANGRGSTAHALPKDLVEEALATLEAELTSSVGAAVRLDEQRAAALAVCCQPGNHAFIEGWAGAGKTTTLRAVAAAHKSGGMRVIGCCLSAAAAQNLSREAGIRSRTLASLLLALKDGRLALDARCALVLDEAGMVGSREFALLQQEVVKAGAKLICVGDPKQLQPIGAGGIFKSLMERHGRAEIATIQRQRTDHAPLFEWISSGKAAKVLGIDPRQLSAINRLPEDARLRALRDLGAGNSRLAKALDRWSARFDHAWMRQAVADIATGDTERALRAMDARGRLRLVASQGVAIQDLIADWSADKAPIQEKAIIAATRAEARSLNDVARDALIARGVVQDERGTLCAILRDGEEPLLRRFAPGDRIAFTQNDPGLGVVNGALGSITALEVDRQGAPVLRVELDEVNARGERLARIPCAFGRFDHAYCLTNHKSQGRTFSSAFALLNPVMIDREWAYVALSRSRFGTTLYAPAGAMTRTDEDSHQAPVPKREREELVRALAVRMNKSRAKGTTLDWSAAGAAPASAAESRVDLVPEKLKARLSLLAQWAKQRAAELAPTRGGRG
ncbi:relaxase domain-containing protein [Aquincola tertiaricarbonis]|uniref:Relaxase domain-containing protein n=1 Tax=Aquincola tertiaricarbonis TaxID=391953 RepID=A0ABY4SCJ6_AQUTE|nr:MobF family relaxase [Aquincola tertiaricarbonis]URI09438.1 relaxase domain-containing protein [Aquincola tertiaricarbonis]